jgi:DNA-binding CsgD family transcriptional regulator
LRRALAESPCGPDRLDVLIDLGQAELRTNVPDAVAHLTEAFESATDPRTAATVAEHLAAATCEREDAKAAIGVLDRAIARLGGDANTANPDLVADLDILALGIGAGVTSLAYAHRIERLTSRAAERPGAARAIASITAYRLSAAGRSRRESVALAREVLALGPPEAMRDFYAYRDAALSLTRAGELNLALRCADVLVARGAALNQPTFAGNGHALRGWAALRAGRLADAVDETHAAITAHSLLCRDSGPQGPEVYLIEAYLDLGEPAEAARLLARIGLLGGGPMPYWAIYALESRGRYRLRRDDPAGALSDFLEAGRHLVDCGVVNPAAGAWRSNAALVLHRLGDDAAALRLAAEELALARRWGASGPLGVALRATGLIRGEAAPLEESVAVLAGSPARLEHARSLYELGRFRVERRDRDSSRDRARDRARGLLREAYVIAMDCGAAPLVAQIGAALGRAGARRPRPRPSGVAALTAQERRVAELAAAGATNKEIAEALFLIQRTVETHLTSVYRKLGIKGRRTLAAALGG